MAEIVVRQENSGSTVSAQVGDSLIVELPENPTTGFQWAPAEFDHSFVAPQTDEFIMGSNTGVGAGGVRVFRFLVRRPGSGRLQLRLARAWAAGAPSKFFEIHITGTPQP
jgi:inhibitor of cysteine peptidase